jgi:predicted dehydrogenase
MEKKLRKAIIVYGFGRMGLTHFCILNQLLDDTDFTLVDMDTKINYFARKNMSAKIVSDASKIVKKHDFAIICTPPMFHVSTIEECLNRGDKKIFVEKPFGGINDDYSKVILQKEDVKIGYVLRFIPVIQWIKNNLPFDRITKFEGSYFSNSIEMKPKGWRNSKYSGVCNEMGSHIIDLAVYTLGLKNFTITNKKIESVVSDVDDIASFELEAEGKEYKFHFDWVNKNYRKPIFSLKYYLDDNSYYIVDQQKIEKFDSKHNLILTVSTVDIAESTPFYLRGVEFTNQMKDFIEGQEIIASVDEALVTREIIKNILK